MMSAGVCVCAWVCMCVRVCLCVCVWLWGNQLNQKWQTISAHRCTKFRSSHTALTARLRKDRRAHSAHQLSDIGVLLVIRNFKHNHPVGMHPPVLRVVPKQPLACHPQMAGITLPAVCWVLLAGRSIVGSWRRHNYI